MADERSCTRSTSEHNRVLGSRHSNILAGVAGITADSNTLVNLARNVAQGHLQTYNEDMPVEQLVRRICDTKQGYTQFGGVADDGRSDDSGQRPFGVSFLFAGHDPHYQFQLYASDPSGNYSGWKANCIGANNSTAQSLLRQDYKDDFGIDEALALAVKVLGKTMDSTTLDAEKGPSEAIASSLCSRDRYPHDRREDRSPRRAHLQRGRGRCPAGGQRCRQET